MTTASSFEKPTIQINYKMSGLRNAALSTSDRTLEITLPGCTTSIIRPIVGRDSWEALYQAGDIRVSICLNGTWRSIKDWEDFLSFVSS